MEVAVEARIWALTAAVVVEEERDFRWMSAAILKEARMSGNWTLPGVESGVGPVERASSRRSWPPIFARLYSGASVFLDGPSLNI